MGDKIVTPYFNKNREGFNLQAVSEFVAELRQGKIAGFMLAYRVEDEENWDHIITHHDAENKDMGTLNLLLDVMKRDLLALEARRSETTVYWSEGD